MKMENLSQKQSTTNGGADGLTEMKEQFTELSNSVKSFKDRIESSAATIENIEEKMYDFEVGKKNNLIFYGIPGETRETPSVLIMKADRTLALKRNVFDNHI